MSTPPGLGPHLIGTRVVVRRLLPGRTGPSGGPAMTDLLGVMESWDGSTTTVRAESGEVTRIRLAEIVSGKAVPPRPSTRLRVSPADAERRANASWPALEAVPLGDWLLRASAGFSSRANSTLAAGDPGRPLAAALTEVRRFYSARALPAWAQVVVGSDVQRAMEEAGWVGARPGEADTLFQVAAVSRARRQVRRTLPPDVPGVRMLDRVDAGWLAEDERARTHATAAVQVLQGPDQVGFAQVELDGRVRAKGRVAGALGTTEDWVGLTDIWVAPSHRRQGLGSVVLGALLEWAAERGATTAFLQTRGDNAAALAMYDGLGFVTHHRYRYLAAGGLPQTTVSEGV